MRDYWEQARLADVSTRVIGRTPPRKESRYWTADASERPFCTIADMKSRHISGGSEGVTALAEREGKAKRVPGGSMLLSFKLSLGRVGFSTRDVFPNEAIAWIRPKPEVLEGFLALALEGLDWSAVGSRAVKGTTLNSDSLDTLPIPLPPLSEQRRIVDLIGAVDEAIEAARDHVAALDELLLAAQDDIPYAPTSKLGDILQGIDSGTSAQAENCPYSSTDKRILTVSAVRPARFYPDESKVVGQIALPEKGAVREGDLLMTRSNTPDRVGYVCVARDVAQHTYMPDLIWRLRVDESKVSTKYLEHALSSQRLRRAITAIGTGTSQSMRKINKRGVAGIQVPMPIAPEQAEYVERAESIIRVLRDAQSFRDVLRTLRASLLSALLSGEHRIPEPYDELVGA